MFLKPCCVLAIAAATLAMTESASAQPTRTTHARAQEARKISPSADKGKILFVLRQDLFDRNDPNNLRSDYPGPPAQPGAVR
jgi:hypothetical protein